MTDPTTSNVLLAIPTRGSDSGTWDLPVNGNMSGLDGMLGGNTTISLSSNTTIILTSPATGTVSAGAGPNQSQNNVIKLTGTLTGNNAIKLTLPRTYCFDTTGLTFGAFVVVIQPSSGTSQACLPPGEVSQIMYDGANVKHMNLNRVGAYIEIAGISTAPLWMSASIPQPYLPCDGATYSTAAFPVLGAILGSTFGGNGITTFGVPDTRNRFVIPVDTSGQGRVTNAISGVDGTVVGSAGGDQRMQSHTHTATVTENPHAHSYPRGTPGSDVFGVTNITNTATNTSSLTSTGLTVANANAGTGSSQNMPPVIVFGCGFVKT